jgi:uncharacterized membrane protein YuzA (DUF378 family)
MKALHMIAFVLVVVGGLNWGLVGAFEFNLVTKLLGSWPMVETIVYVLVGLSALQFGDGLLGILQGHAGSPCFCSEMVDGLFDFLHVSLVLSWNG